MDKPSINKVYEFEEFRLDAVHLMLYRKNREVPLAPKAVETLIALVEKRGEVVSKDELMNIIWTDSIVEESNLFIYLHQIRKTLGNRKNGKPFIETYRRRGYRFNGDVALSGNANVFSPHRRRDAEEIKNNFLDAAAETRIQNRPVLRVKRHGNVLALADWIETEPPAPADTEQPEALEKRPAKLNNRLVFAVAAAVAVILLGVFLVFLWSSLNSRSSPEKKVATFSNLTDGEIIGGATISPDGNYCVYVLDDGEKAHLWLQQTEQTSRIEVTEPLGGEIYSTSFTPDSQFVYFVAKESKYSLNTLYRAPALGGVRTKILSDIAGSPSFSPDGREMVFIRVSKENNRSEIIIASSDGKQERTILTKTGDNPEASFNGGAWSPDGKTIAFGLIDLKDPLRRPCTIVGIDVESGETRPISNEKWDNCFRLAWTHDGQGIVFIGTKQDEGFSTQRDQVYYLSIANGESRRLTTAGNRHQAESLGVTVRDEILVVPFNRLSQIWAMDAGGDSQSVVQITKGQADGRGGIAPLPDGRVAYMTRHGDGFSIWLMNSDGSSRKQLTTEPSAIEEVRAAPDGSFFVFSVKEDGWNHLYRIDADGSNLKQLTSGKSNAADSTISPDGRWIIYDSKVSNGDLEKTALWKISTAGGDPAILANTECITPHYSPDGRFLSCVSGDWEKILILSADDGRIEKTFETRKNPVLNVGSRWTPDGEAVAYVVFYKHVENIYLQAIDGKASKPLTDFTSGDIYNFAFSADGTRLYTARGYTICNAVLIRNFK